MTDLAGIARATERLRRVNRLVDEQSAELSVRGQKLQDVMIDLMTLADDKRGGEDAELNAIINKHWPEADA